MKIRAITLTTVFLMSFTAAAVAQVPLRTRTFVSSAGNDANSCTFSAPCRTFAEAIAGTAVRGEVTALDSAVYGESINITRSMTIQAAPGVQAILGNPSTSYAVEINADESSVVILRNLYISPGRKIQSAQPMGIKVNSVGTVYIENCIVSGWTYGIFASIAFQQTFIPKLFMKDSTVINNEFGIALTNYSASIDHSRFEGNSKGLLVGSSEPPTNPGGQTGTTLSDCLIKGNSLEGIVFDGDRLDVENCVITLNGTGIHALGVHVGAANVSNTRISGNVTGLVRDPGSVIRSFRNNRLYGNQTDGTFSSTLDQQ